MIKLLSRLKISILFISSILLFSSVLILLQTIVLFRSTASFLEKKISQNSLQVSQQIGERIENALQNVLEISMNIRLSAPIREFEELDISDSYAQLCLISDVNSSFSSITHSNKNILGIYLLTNHLTMYNYAEPNGIFKLDRLQGTELYSAIKKADEGFIATQSDYFSQNAFSAKPRNAFYYFYTIKDRHKKDIGTLLICIDEAAFANSYLLPQGDGNSLLLFDNEGHLISPYPLGKENLEENLSLYNEIELAATENNESYFTLNYHSAKYLCTPIQLSNDWKLIHLQPYSTITDGISQLRIINIQIGFLGIVFALLVTIIFSQALIRPIHELIKKINQLGADNLDINFDESLNNEIGDINRQMNKITRRLKKNIEELKQKQELMLQSECKALQSQINPHFLYNTLDAINWMAIRADVMQISEMTANLGAFFRHSLNKGKLLTTIEEELAHLDAYLAIQGYRYNHRFTYRCNITAQILPCTIVNLVLQPLVENSLLHGAASTNGACLIEIEGNIVGNDIIIDVRDDGCGCDSAFMNQCLSKNISMSEGYGVINVHQRLKIFFGPPYGLEFLPVSSGTQVRIRIPLHCTKDEGNSNAYYITSR